MRRGILFIAILAVIATTKLSAQKIDPAYYDYPLRNVAGYFSANFAEMRSNHFHSGIDIKTDGVEGKPVVAIADGYIARVADKPSGYGRALYVVHPDKGTMSVYAHLCRFGAEVDSMMTAERYRLQRNSLDLHFGADRYPVKQGEIIGYSGNSGNSFGPHLHFEMWRAGNPLNPEDFIQFK